MVIVLLDGQHRQGTVLVSKIQKKKSCSTHNILLVPSNFLFIWQGTDDIYLPHDGNDGVVPQDEHTVHLDNSSTWEQYAQYVQNYVNYVAYIIQSSPNGIMWQDNIGRPFIWL